MDLPFDAEDETIGDTGIKIHPTMFQLDSSKIQMLMDCPRGFFFQHILGWEQREPNVHLVFGSAWHEAMRHVLEHGTDKKSIRGGYQIFKEIFEKDFSNDPFTEEHYSKNPGNALQGLADYAATFPVDPSNTIYTEIAGAAPIREDRQIHFKMDAIRKHPESHQEAGKYYALEHKTTSRKTQSWQEKWNYKFQVGTYLHALNAWLGDRDKLDGLTIGGSIFRKNDTEHLRIPIRKDGEQMLEWLWTANYWWDYYEEQMRKLTREVTPDDPFMVAFPRNTESCGKFGCKFPGICPGRSNPCRQVNPPPGYDVEYWDPTRESSEKGVTFDPDTGEMKSND